MTYHASAVYFDNTTPGSVFLRCPSLSCSDNGTLSVSVWVRMTTSGSGNEVWVADPVGNYNNYMQISAEAPVGVGGIEFELGIDGGHQYDAYAPADSVSFEQWVHILYSIDSNAQKVAMYINDVMVSIVERTTLGLPFDPLINGQPFYIGDDTFGTSFRGAMADLWIAPGVSLLESDSTIAEATRRQFIDNTGAAVDPAGFRSAAILLSGDASTFATNQGTGGAFTLTGVLQNASKAWVAHADPLLISIDQTYAGQNAIDNRTVWHGLADITFSTGSISGSVWWKDFGPKGDPDSMLEPRAYCIKGHADFAFTGTTLIIRLNTAFSWYTGAVVTIDGVAPSTLDLLTAVDTLSCDSASYGLDSDAYLDVVVADGLADTDHTCRIVINSSDASKFFSLSGFKVGSLASQPIHRSGGWLVATSNLLPQNLVTVTVTNHASHTVLNPTLTFPDTLVDASGDPLTPLTVASLAPAATMTQTVLPVFTGDEVSDDFSYDCTLSAEYHDVNGMISSTVTVTALVGNAVFTVSGSWSTDNSTDTTQTRQFTSSYSATMAFTFAGDVLNLRIQQDFGWGDIGIFANDNTTLLGSVTCASDHQHVVDTSISGFGSGTHDVILRKKDNDGKFIVFVSASWSETLTYTAISETVTLVYSASQPVAMPVQNVVVGHYDVTFDAPVLDTQDYDGTPLRQNTDLVYTEVLTRFPTFCVFYQRGQRDVLAQYDMLIIDPLAASAADVLFWQSKGIKVFGYISSGEEVGFYADRYDFTSGLAPNAGDGPGGSASYYMYTKNPSSGPPDNNGIWASYYTNPDPAFGWPDRLQNYYVPQVLGGPSTITDEIVTASTVTINEASVRVFDTAHSPIDADQPIVLTTMDGSHTYTTYRDYSFDVKTGAFVLVSGLTPAVTDGQQLKISYTRKGHHCDGVFFDTVDTPDVYGSSDFGYVLVPDYADNFANMINNFKAANPDAWLISNRGFTILPQIIQSCKGVMFESWLTLPVDATNLATTDYSRITDSNAVAANDQINGMLRDLRLTHEFDVFSLNYCRDDDDTLRDYCRTEDAKRGYLSWQTTILLNQPGPNAVVNLPGQGFSSAFQRYKTKAI